MFSHITGNVIVDFKKIPIHHFFARCRNVNIVVNGKFNGGLMPITGNFGTVLAAADGPYFPFQQFFLDFFFISCIVKHSRLHESIWAAQIAAKNLDLRGISRKHRGLGSGFRPRNAARDNEVWCPLCAIWKSVESYQYTQTVFSLCSNLGHQDLSPSTKSAIMCQHNLCVALWPYKILDPIGLH